MSQPTRTEKDTFGPIEVPAERLWGAQTQRSLEFFHVSTERMPPALLAALTQVKRAAAKANVETAQLPAKAADAIVRACDEVLAGRHDAEFPLSVWQTGSGTQTNMNLNEVLANRASELLGGPRGAGRLVHPNDDVNRSQSSNDVFPTAMSVAVAGAVVNDVLPSLRGLREALEAKAEQFSQVVKIGRTHLQDATPLTLKQEFSGHVSQLEHAEAHLRHTLPHLHELALGGTAVGTGLNAPRDFAALAVEHLRDATGLALTLAPNRFEALAANDALVATHAALKGLAVALFKIANDVRWLGSGPRAGLGELRLPENEPGSSIMPGKVNPTQCEMLTMVCAQVMGNDVAVSLGGASGAFQLNVYKPLLAHNALQSCRLLAEGMASFTAHCIKGLEANLPRIRENLERSLMLVTALNPHIGYERAAAIAKKAHADGTTLKAAALALGTVTEAQFDEWVKPEAMTGEG